MPITHHGEPLEPRPWINPVPTPEEQALLAAVRDSPGDLLPRLIYADWLEDRGDKWQGDNVRAELIRVQCALAESSSGLLLDKEKQLLSAMEKYPPHEKTWCIPNAVGTPLNAVIRDTGELSMTSIFTPSYILGWRLGFIDIVVSDTEDFPELDCVSCRFNRYEISQSCRNCFGTGKQHGTLLDLLYLRHPLEMYTSRGILSSGLRDYASGIRRPIQYFSDISPAELYRKSARVKQWSLLALDVVKERAERMKRHRDNRG